MLCLSAELHDKDLYQTSGLGFPMSLSGSPTKCASLNRAQVKGLLSLEDELTRKDELGSSFFDTERMAWSRESRESEKVATTSLYRLHLEHDVQSLQEKLHGEIQLRAALESAVGKTAASLSSLICLPDEAQELLNNISALEVTVSKLEEELVSLHFQLSQERNERRLVEYRLKQSPSCFLSNSNSISTPGHPSETFNCSASQLNKSPSVVSSNESSDLNRSNSGCDLEEKKLQEAHHQVSIMVNKGISLKGLWHHPNELSEEMVRCMKNIFICIADSSTISSMSASSNNLQFSTYRDNSNLSATSLSLFSEPSEEDSTVSYMSSPVVEIHCSGDVFAKENTFDPYEVHGKLRWADIGSYSSVVEVSWMCVGKAQLEYASEALQKFRSLVEQLAKVNPTNLTCDEKLAFWINVYNALIMHAYLAYGVPKSELKFFSLMQKAAYTVGGHSFSASAIEYVILKMKPPVHRPQTALLLALHKLKISQEHRKSSLDSPDPLVAFALSSGMNSSPAVRIYTSSKVKEELHQSLQDYVRASVGVSRKGKLYVPKMLHCFFKGVSDDVSLSCWISQFLPDRQAAMVEECVSEKRLRVLGSRNYVSLLIPGSGISSFQKIQCEHSPHLLPSDLYGLRLSSYFSLV